MKQFDAVSIKNRLVKRLQTKDNWKLLIQDSAIDSLLSVIAESEAEDMRYAEYIFREHTWSMAQNVSSVVEAAKYLGYKPKRKISAIGYVYASVDPALVELEVLNTDTLSTFSTPVSNITIANNTTIGDLHFTTEIKTLTPTNPYIMIPIIQGTKKSIVIEENITGIPFQEIRINKSDIEAASDDISSSYFSVRYSPPGGGVVQCTIVDSIFLADAYTDACEVTSYFDENENNDYIVLKFGNGISGKIPPSGSIITLSYIETLGAEGNRESIGDINTSILYNGVVLYLKNLSAVTGGRNRETIDEIRANAPKSYLTEGSIITANQYKQAIENIPSIYKASVYPELNEDEQAFVAFTAIKEDGTPPIKTEIEEALLDRIGDNKSPLDIVAFIPPDFVNISYFYKTSRKFLSTIVLETLTENIQDFVFDTYGILNLDFQSKANSNEINSNINYTFRDSIENSRYFLLAKEPLLNPTVDVQNQQYVLPFSFNPSFGSLLIDSNLPFYMRINLYWDCPELTDFDRTLFIVNNPAFPADPLATPYLVHQFGRVNIIIDNENINQLLNGTLNYIELEVGDVGYIPFDVLTNLNTPLLVSELRVPASYWDNDTEDGCLYINAYAYPEAYKENDIVPLNKNSIINLERDEIFVEVE